MVLFGVCPNLRLRDSNKSPTMSCWVCRKGRLIFESPVCHIEPSCLSTRAQVDKSLYVCMYACMHVCMYVCMYVYVYIYIYM